MPFVKVLRQGVITIPKEIRESLDIDEGQILEAEIAGKGLILKPKVLVDKEPVLSPHGKKKTKAAIMEYKKGK
jgi:AbrB family looped-hinge helix DNA binding protein